ncbi:hypothetical protein ACZ87_01560 [Candidatus Erwinia dacicola]|uniref:Uncharacterized protein n=1 Tax=Candidatus Erwinia dacicola TaxID=252393 RepID=A0A328TN25_9GAMM|nr:hypothetical protein ACZ87_01560 [Candidatus Erwinia dacicola]
MRLGADAGKIRPEGRKYLKNRQQISVSDENSVIDWWE